MTERDTFWEQPEVVARLAAMQPDHRLQAMIESHPHPERLHTLDVGCAAGRNTVYLASHGADVLAVDLSLPMVEMTRERLAPILGADEARRRVRQGSMEELGWVSDESMDLVIGLGIYHQAEDVDAWHRAVAESARVLRQGGELLVAHFAPGTDLTGRHGASVSGREHIHETRDGNALLLLDAETLDAFMAVHDLIPAVQTATVTAPNEGGGRKVTVNGLYRKGTAGR